MPLPYGMVLHDFLDGPWEEVRGFLKEELDQLYVSLSAQLGVMFTENNTITQFAIGGNHAPATRYVGNTGPGNSPQWTQVDLLNGVTGDLPFSNIVPIPTGTVLGNGSGGDSDITPLTLGSDLIADSSSLDLSIRAKAGINIALFTHCGGI